MTWGSTTNNTTTTTTTTSECTNCETLEDNTPKFSLGCCIKLDADTQASLKTICEKVDISWNSTCNGRTTICTDGIQALKNLLTSSDQDAVELRHCLNLTW
ncbi:MAG: hypothetical protein H6850_02600 [Alphaproteobacteria bacterium]|nr:MAG: hypothetical protein H6850_02600 [Alphaproteobacteria bacterium]